MFLRRLTSKSLEEVRDILAVRGNHSSENSWIDLVPSLIDHIVPSRLVDIFRMAEQELLQIVFEP